MTTFQIDDLHEEKRYRYRLDNGSYMTHAELMRDMTLQDIADRASGAVYMFVVETSFVGTVKYGDKEVKMVSEPSVVTKETYYIGSQPITLDAADERNRAVKEAVGIARSIAQTHVFVTKDGDWMGIRDDAVVITPTEMKAKA